MLTHTLLSLGIGNRESLCVCVCALFVIDCLLSFHLRVLEPMCSLMLVALGLGVCLRIGDLHVRLALALVRLVLESVYWSRWECAHITCHWNHSTVSFGCHQQHLDRNFNY